MNQPNRAMTEPPTSRERKHVRVCLITTEFHGLFKNGGIGTANTGLALALAEAGFDVTVSFADADENGPRVKEGNFLELKEKYHELGITLDFVPASTDIHNAFSDTRSASYCVYLYLRQHEFDVVYFNDCGGQGYYSLLAKRVGVFPNPPQMYVVTHGPQEWVLELNSMLCWDRWPVITAYLERRSAALADILISPSRYLIDWMIARGWTLPNDVRVIQNIVRLPESLTHGSASKEPVPVTEIVFFGRLEVRKGVELFCDAIDLLQKSVDLSKFRITFMGKFSQIASLHSGIYVLERARHWRSSLRILAKYGQEEAVSYLSRPGVLAVIPSLAENSPCVVAECLQLALPFVASNSGGTAELVAAEDRDRCLVAPEPHALMKKLEEVLRTGQGASHLAIPQADILPKWLRLTEDSTAEHVGNSGPETSVTEPLVSICLALTSLSPASEALIASLLSQNYFRLEFLLPDDEALKQRISAMASDNPQHKPIPLRVFPAGSNRVTMQNAAAKFATGEYIFFVDEENVILMPQCIETLVTAAIRTGADVVTGVPLQVSHTARPIDRRDGKLRYFPIGDCAELGAFENCFGKGAFLVKRTSLGRTSGFESVGSLEVEEWLFLAQAALAGLHFEVVPEPFFWQRARRALDLTPSKTVDYQRRILDAYSSQKIKIIRNMIEAMVHIDRSIGERRREALSGMSSQARELAIRVSSAVEPNDEEAIRGFVQFCLERQKTEEALDFALHNGRSVLSDAIESAKKVAETLALDAVRRHALDLWHNVRLSDDVRERIRPVPSFPARNFGQQGDDLAEHSIDAGLIVLKAAAACPPGVTSMRAVATVDEMAPPSLKLALAVSAPNARLRLSDQGLKSDEAFSWSGWVSPKAGGETLEISVRDLEPSTEVQDLHFLCRTDTDGPRPEGKVTWRSVTATISVNGTVSASGVAPDERAIPVPRRVLDQGILLTENLDFPFPVFVPGDTTLHHPLPGRMALVRVPVALPPGSKGVRGVVSLEREESHPVQFAMWIKSPSFPVTSESDLNGADAFSGWFSVRDKFRHHSFTLNLDQPAKESLDLYLATRVVEFPDVHYCHAVWNELLILE